MRMHVRVHLSRHVLQVPLGAAVLNAAANEAATAAAHICVGAETSIHEVHKAASTSAATDRLQQLLRRDWLLRLLQSRLAAAAATVASPAEVSEDGGVCRPHLAPRSQTS